jgi:hypothetical protein
MLRPERKMGTMHIVLGWTIVVVYSNPRGLWSCAAYVSFRVSLDWARKGWAYLGPINGSYRCYESLSRQYEGDVVDELLDILGAGRFGAQLAELGADAGML